MTDMDTTTQIESAGGHQVVVYPSGAVRPVPSFVFAAPDGWVVDDAPGAVAVIRAPKSADEFWDNAMITHDRVARSVDLEAAATASWRRLKAGSPSATVNTERVARFGNNVVYLRGVDLEAPQSGRKLAQLQALFLAPAAENAKTVDLFQIIGTSTADNMAVAGRTFVEIIASFRFL